MTSTNQKTLILGMTRQALGLSVIRLADGLGIGILLVVIPLYVPELPASLLSLPQSVLIGIVVSLNGLIGSTLQPVAGRLSDRVGVRKPFIQGGLTILAVTSLAYIFVERYEVLLLLRILQGFGSAFIHSASTGLIASITEQTTRGQSMGVYKGVRMLGLTVGPMIGVALQINLGFNMAFLASAVSMLFGLLLVHYWVHEAPVTAPYKAVSSSMVSKQRAPSATFISLSIAILLIGSSFAMVAALKNHFSAQLQMTVLGFGLAFSAHSLSRLLFQVPLGVLSDRIGHKRLILLGLGIMAPATVMLGLVDTISQFTALRVVQGIASAGIAASTLALAADLSSPGDEAMQMSIVGMGFGLGTAIGPLISGILVLFTFETPFIVGGLMALVGLWIVYSYVPKREDQDLFLEQR